MTSGVYPRKPGPWAGNGGKRRHSVAPYLTREQVRVIRELRAGGARIKVLAALYEVHTSTINNVLHSRNAYKDMK